MTDANLFSANAHTLSHHILFLLLNLLSLSAVLHFSISPLFKHLCGARCTSAPWVFCTPVRRMLAPDLCFGPLKAGKVSWWTIFSGCHSDERGLGEVQWYWDAVTALSMWILTLRYGDALRLWTETAMRWDAHAHTHHYCSQRSGWSYCPWICIRRWQEPQAGRKPCGVEWGTKGDLWVSACAMMNVGETLRWSFAL